MTCYNTCCSRETLHNLGSGKVHIGTTTMSHQAEDQSLRVIVQ